MCWVVSEDFWVNRAHFTLYCNIIFIMTNKKIYQLNVPALTEADRLKVLTVKILPSVVSVITTRGGNLTDGLSDFKYLSYKSNTF